MFTGVLSYKKTSHHELYNFRLLCHNAAMSTLCRVKWERRNVRGSRPSRSLCGASRAALPVKDVSGGMPITARGTHALPIRLSSILRVRSFHSPANHSPARIPSAPLENTVKSRIEEGRKVSDWTEGRSSSVKLSQSESKQFGQGVTAAG
jgi:hypothetical protein